jgi:hypothetical protein
MDLLLDKHWGKLTWQLKRNYFKLLQVVQVVVRVRLT